MSIWLLIKVFSTLESSSDWILKKRVSGFVFIKPSYIIKHPRCHKLQNISIFQLKIVKKEYNVQFTLIRNIQLPIIRRKKSNYQTNYRNCIVAASLLD